MNIIKIYKDKITVSDFNEENLIFSEIDINYFKKPLNFYFGKIVEFAEDITVFDFIKHLYQHKEIIDCFFTAYNNNVKIEEFYNECLVDDFIKINHNLERVEIVWETDVFQYDFLNTKSINNWVTFFGIHSPENGKNIEIRSINLIQLRHWKNLNFKLNKNIVFQEINLSQDIQINKILSGIKEFTLFDLISGFLKELTWYGNPKEQYETSKEFFKKIKEINKNLSEEKQENKLKKLEEELKDCIEKEDYIKAKKIKDEIDMKNK